MYFSQSLDEYKQHVRLVFSHLLENRLFLKVERCEFHVSSVNFLGFIIGQGQVKIDIVKGAGSGRMTNTAHQRAAAVLYGIHQLLSLLH